MFTVCFTSTLACAAREESGAHVDERPHILFAISDDQSWMHAGAYGDRGTKTPAFDRIAHGGVLFNYAFTACPSCTPARSAILTGQQIYRLEEGGVLMGFLPKRFPTFTRLLEDTGYEIASTGKTWSPGRLQPGGWKRPPTGKAYNTLRLQTKTRGLSSIDYAANFSQFIDERDVDRPFFFWFGASEPHQSYDVGAWRRAGKNLADARLPRCLPDDPTTRGEILDYGLEIEHFDRHLASMLNLLEARGLSDNTIVIVTSDHGNPLPRAKCNLYDVGVRVPLAIRWPRRIPAGRTLDDFTSLTDIAPTLLEIAGIGVPSSMTGRSLRNLLVSTAEGRTDPDRDFVVTAFERHTICRRDGLGYPMRAIHTHRYTYIRNYEPDRWPAGAPDFVSSHQGFYGDIDRGASKSFMIAAADRPAVARLFQLAFGRRPAEELYDMKEDPHQLTNLAGQPELEATRAELAERLKAYLKLTEDPRVTGKSPWDTYPFYAPEIFRSPSWRTAGRSTKLPE